MAFFSPLPSRRIIHITGPDAKAFLQGLLSVDVLKIQAYELRYGLLLSPQGKFLHDMFIVGLEEGLLLDVCKVQAETLLKRLKLYKLKRDVVMQLSENTHVGVLFGADATIPKAKDIMVMSDPRLSALGFRAYAEKPLSAADFGANAAKPDDYVKHRVSLGVPGSTDMIPEKNFAFDFDMEDLHAVDYTKGCYVGQEVTARMHYRGTPKKGVYQITTMDGSELKTGMEITVGGKAAGTVASAAGNMGLAMLRHEHAAGGVLLAVSGVTNSSSIRATRPAWTKPTINSNEESV